MREFKNVSSVSYKHRIDENSPLIGFLTYNEIGVLNMAFGLMQEAKKYKSKDDYAILLPCRYIAAYGNMSDKTAKKILNKFVNEYKILCLYEKRYGCCDWYYFDIDNYNELLKKAENYKTTLVYNHNYKKEISPKEAWEYMIHKTIMANKDDK